MIERASSADVVLLATDVGSAPMHVGAVLLLERGTFDQRGATAVIADRIRAVPRLRQRLVATPRGCGRPVWVDDADFDLSNHVSWVACPAPGDEEALLATASEVIGTRLPRERPLWRLTFVSHLQGGRTALVVAFHHVLADGIGGLAVLTNLVDGTPPTAPRAFPQPAPTTGELARDATAARVRALAGLRASVRPLWRAIAQMRSTAGAGATPSTLNRPTGSRRRLAVVRADLGQIRRTAHAHDATVNDVVLTAIAGALHTLMASRGESVDELVVSLPVSARRQASANQLGNQVGVVPVHIPGKGDPLRRLDTISGRTRVAKQTPAAGSTPLLGAVFRILARLGLFGWFIDRQRLVHTFVTNLRGPESRLTFLDTPITDVIAVAVITGNVTVSFAVLSYAGTLDITVISDPDAFPDLGTLCGGLKGQLDQLTNSTRSGTG